MKNHLRGNLLLLLFTVVLCCVLYPAVMYALGRGLFPTGTSGGLVNDKGESVKDAAIGSPLIAQPFTSDEYFWPRPSAASYNATASGGSNLGANNPKLRDRVAQQIGPMVLYKAGRGTGRTPQQDMADWLAADPSRVTIPPDGNASALAFDLWLSDPANASKVADLEPVVADMVTTSGSGLDPHITVRNALSVYQLDRVARKRAASPTEFEKIKVGIAELVRAKSFTPLWGLVGEPLVNVLELNIELNKGYPLPG